MGATLLFWILFGNRFGTEADTAGKYGIESDNPETLQ